MLESPINQRFLIEYLSQEGEETERVVEIRGIKTYRNVMYVDAYCFLRDAERTFRCDRMKSLMNRETGELLKPLSFFGPFSKEIQGGFAPEYIDIVELAGTHRAQSPAEKRVANKTTPGLKVLIWVLKAGDFDDDKIFSRAKNYKDQLLLKSLVPQRTTSMMITSMAGFEG